MSRVVLQAILKAQKLGGKLPNQFLAHAAARGGTCTTVCAWHEAAFLEKSKLCPVSQKNWRPHIPHAKQESLQRPPVCSCMLLRGAGASACSLQRCAVGWACTGSGTCSPHPSPRHSTAKPARPASQRWSWRMRLLGLLPPSLVPWPTRGTARAAARAAPAATAACTGGDAGRVGSASADGPAPEPVLGNPEPREAPAAGTASACEAPPERSRDWPCARQNNHEACEQRVCDACGSPRYFR